VWVIHVDSPMSATSPVYLQHTDVSRHCNEPTLGPRPWENSSAVRARRRISENVRIMKLNHPAQIRLDTVLENCIFYISPMYEFSHSLGP
jgi:hypothetical protein